MALRRAFRGGEDVVGVDDDAAAADPGHATRIGSPLRKGGNRRPGAGEGLPLCLGSLVATLMGLPRGEDAVGVDDDAAAAEPGHATRISSPLRKRGNRRIGAGEGLPLSLGSLVATLLGLPPEGGHRPRGED